MSRKSPNFKRNNSIAELIADTRKPRLLPDTAWYKVGMSQAYQIGFTNSWVNVGGSGNPDAQWHVDHSGEAAEARVIGLIDEGEVGKVVFNFPEETRPRHREVFVCAVEGGGTANVAVYPNGDVIVENYNG